MRHPWRIFSLLVFPVALFGLAQSASAATLQLTPSSATIMMGQTISVDIMLDTGGLAIDGVDVYSLRYNPAVLEVQDSNSSLSGIQISPGSLFPVTLTNGVSNGAIQFSQVTSGGTSYVGSGKLATVTFKGLANGVSPVTFDFTLGSTADSNVAGGGQDKLTSVGNGNYAVGSGIDATPPAPPVTSTGTGGAGSSHIYGCMDKSAINYSSSANFDNGACIYSASATTSVTTLATTTTVEVRKIPVAQLLGQIEVLRTQLATLSGGTSDKVVSAKYIFMRNLKLGMKNSEVKKLQKFLNANGFPIATTGHGSKGKETTYFGMATQKALMRYQKFIGITPANGFLGTLTRERMGR